MRRGNMTSRPPGRGMSAAVAAAVGRVVAGVAAVVVAPTLLICRSRRRGDKGSGRSAATSRRDSIERLESDKIKLAEFARPDQRIRDDLERWETRRGRRPNRHGCDDIRGKDIRRPVDPPGDFIACAPTLPVIRAVTLDLKQRPGTSRGPTRHVDDDVMRHGSLEAFKGSGIVPDVEERRETSRVGQDLQSSCAWHLITWCDIGIPDSLELSPDRPLPEKALVLEESTGLRDFEPRPFRPTGEGEYDYDKMPSQELVANRHGAVSYTKCQVKPLDRQRSSYESITTSPTSDDDNIDDLLTLASTGDEPPQFEYLPDRQSSGDVHLPLINVPITGQPADYDLASESESDGVIVAPEIEFDVRPSSHVLCDAGSNVASASPYPDLPPEGDALHEVVLAQESTDCEPPQKKSRGLKIDYSEAVEPSQGDVLCGRGGHTTKHPGNIRFRQKAAELRREKVKCKKVDKYRMSEILTEFVTGQGHHFLKEGPDRKWYRVLNPRIKASQLLREDPDKTKAIRKDSDDRSTTSPSSVTEGWQDIDSCMENGTPGTPTTGHGVIYIAMSNPVEPSENDVLCGRGDFTKTHPGNIHFREKVMELLQRYHHCSMEEKFKLSVEVIESVTKNGHSFLKKVDGKWYRVNGGALRKKSSQAFRDAREKILGDFLDSLDDVPLSPD
ncbi:hypothetical protein ACHAXA_006951 [Cyclostephanos tholiformis]|uniref:DUF6824 domain-containing protein n=1 Tax=Cyclostephanos tholiformis TaxID=382380 RepID=A0ABD3RXC5_9STRA